MSCSRSGFSLIEAVIAVAILLATCLTVSMTLAIVLRADRQVERRAVLEEVLGSERARLASLPYRRTPAAPVIGAAWLPDPPSLLGEVFPHAAADHDGTAGSYRIEGDVGVFVTHRTIQGFKVVGEARFVRRGDAGWVHVPAASTQGWRIWEAQLPPAATVELCLTATRDSAAASARIILGALRPRVEPEASGLGGAHES